LELDLATFRAYVDGREAALTPIEFNVLRCLMEHAGRVVSSDTLLLEVWGYEGGTGDPDLVRAHVSKLRSKLARSSLRRVEYIKTSLGHGYMIPAEGQH